MNTQEPLGLRELLEDIPRHKLSRKERRQAERKAVKIAARIKAKYHKQ